MCDNRIALAGEMVQVQLTIRITSMSYTDELGDPSSFEYTTLAVECANIVSFILICNMYMVFKC